MEIKNSSFLKKVANSKDENSYVTKLRKKRFELINILIEKVNKENINILDVGGTPEYWTQIYNVSENKLNLNITLLNLDYTTNQNPFFKYMIGDARNLSDIRDKQFDICFSNSLIEHIGDLSQQILCAREMKRVADYIYLQTPNFYFPIEPHFMQLFVHWFPFTIKMKLHSILGRRPLKSVIDEYIDNPINLLSISELEYLFNKDNFIIYKEKIGILTKSLIVMSR